MISKKDFIIQGKKQDSTVANWILDFVQTVGAGTVDNMKIGFAHTPKDARKLAESSQFNIVFYGHTHKPWEESINGCKMVNPGNMAGVFYKATFAVFDIESGNLSLKIVENL